MVRDMHMKDEKEVLLNGHISSDLEWPNRLIFDILICLLYLGNGLRRLQIWYIVWPVTIAIDKLPLIDTHKVIIVF